MIEGWRTARATVRLLGRVPVLLRATVFVTCAVAIAATIAPSWDVPNAYLYIAGVTAIVATLAPDSGAGACFAGAVVVAWATGADRTAVGPAVVVTALALLVGHVAAAMAAALPATAEAPPALLLRWWRPTALLAAATVAAALLVAPLDAWSPPGSIVVVVAALVVVGVGVWWWSVGDEA